jgi:hypothetical protein
MDIRVMALEDVMATKLLALTEHSLRYESLLQIDWPVVRAQPRVRVVTPQGSTATEGG